jgi:membrane-associated phospholipid phosphatase
LGEAGRNQVNLGKYAENSRQATTPLAPRSFLPDSKRLRVYGYWAGLSGLVFIAVYPTLNWLTSVRRTRFQLYVAPELDIPFVPQFIWAYLSMYLLFLAPLFLLPAERMPTLGRQLVAGTVASGVIFLLLPADLGFIRVIPSDPIYATIYQGIFGIDRPHNLVPSLHVVWSSTIILACADIARPLSRCVLYLWLVVVVLSTVLVHQHHILDVMGAMLIVFVVRRSYRVAPCINTSSPPRC